VHLAATQIGFLLWQYKQCFKSLAVVVALKPQATLILMTAIVCQIEPIQSRREGLK